MCLLAAFTAGICVGPSRAASSAADYAAAAALDTTYLVTITGGTFDGGADSAYFAAGERVGIETTPERGRHFNGWAVRGPGRIVNSAQLQTAFVVGEGEAHLRAVFEDSLYRVSVDRGIGGGTYPANSTVELRAYVPEGATFTGWTHEGAGELADPSDPESTFTTGYGPSVLTVGIAYDSTALRIRARGWCGTEGMTLQIDGRNVAVWQDVPSEPTDFFWGGEVGQEVRVYLNNAGVTDAGCRHELAVEYLDYGGRRHYGAEQALNTGQRVPGGDCSPESGIRSERLVCRGYILFATMGETDESTADASATVDGEDARDALTLPIQLRPNPARRGEHVMLELGDGFGPGAEVTLSDMAGALRERFVVTGVGAAELSTAHLDPGIYVARVRGADGRRTGATRLLVSR